MEQNKEENEEETMKQNKEEIQNIEMRYSIDVLRLHQKWGWLSNVMDFYQNNNKYNQWWENYEKENQEFLDIGGLAPQDPHTAGTAGTVSAAETERQLLELENSIIEEYF